MKQVLFYIPIRNAWFPDGIPVFGFGMMLFVTFLLTTGLARRRAQREGIAKEHIENLVIWLFVGGLLGARIIFLLEETPWVSFGYFLKQLPRIWEGGIVLYGSVMGALVGYLCAYLLIFRRYQLSTLKLADICAPSLAIGICLGRLGCFLNGCCYGQVACADCPVYAVHFPLSAPPRETLVRAGYQTVAGFTLAGDQPTDRPGVVVGQVEPDSPAWANGLRPGDRIVRLDNQEVNSPGELSDLLFNRWPRGKNDLKLEVYHAGAKEATELPPFSPHTLGLYPTQLYEAISMFLLFLLLLAYYPFRRHDGQVMALLMMGYAVHRALNEVLRDDPRPEGFEKYTSWFLFAAGLVLWLWLWSRPAQYRTEVNPAAVPEPVKV
jgi:phosphatidylglycerol:prolipoprotein diacylglycerol transferase